MTPGPFEGNDQAEGRVSVWIGTFPGQDAFDDYLKEEYSSDGDDVSCRFRDDLGIHWHDHDFQEAVFQANSVPVTDLISGVSWIESYKTELLARCSTLGIATGNAVIAISEYNFPEAAGLHSPHLTFVGAFSYSTGGSPFRRDRPDSTDLHPVSP